MLLNIVEIITIIISLTIAVKSFRQENGKGRLIVYILFFFICIMPLVLDYIIGLPDYTVYNINGRYNGFIKTYDDLATRIIYCAFLLVAQYILTTRTKFIFGNKSKIEKSNNVNTEETRWNFEKGFEAGYIDQKMRIIAFSFSLIPVIIVLIAGNTKILYTFGWRDFHLFDHITSQSWYSFVEKLSYLGVTASIILILMKHDCKNRYVSLLYRLFAAILLFMNICAESKRSILFFAIIIFFSVLLYGRNIQLKKILVLAIIVIGLAFIYSVYIKITARNYAGFEAIYTALRIDVFRDDRIRMAIYGMLHSNEIHILDFPFQSYLYQIKFFFFLDIIVGKLNLYLVPAIGYNRFFSSALSGIDLSYGLSYMTTSMFDEAIANFGVIGFVFAPIVCRKVSSAIDSASNFEKIFLIGSLTLAMMYSLNYILVYIEFTFFIHIYKRFKIRSN